MTPGWFYQQISTGSFSFTVNVLGNVTLYRDWDRAKLYPTNPFLGLTSKTLEKTYFALLRFGPRILPFEVTTIRDEGSDFEEEGEESEGEGGRKAQWNIDKQPTALWLQFIQDVTQLVPNRKSADEGYCKLSLAERAAGGDSRPVQESSSFEFLHRLPVEIGKSKISFEQSPCGSSESPHFKSSSLFALALLSLARGWTTPGHLIQTSSDRYTGSARLFCVGTLTSWSFPTPTIITKAKQSDLLPTSLLRHTIQVSSSLKGCWRNSPYQEQGVAPVEPGSSCSPFVQYVLLNYGINSGVFPTAITRTWGILQRKGIALDSTSNHLHNRIAMYNWNFICILTSSSQAPSREFSCWTILSTQAPRIFRSMFRHCSMSTESQCNFQHLSFWWSDDKTLGGRNGFHGRVECTRFWLKLAFGCVERPADGVMVVLSCGHLENKTVL